MLVDLALNGDRMGELVLDTAGEMGILRLGNVVRPMGGADVGMLLAAKALAGMAVSIRAILGDLCARSRSWSHVQQSVALLDEVEAAVDGPLSSTSLSSVSLPEDSVSELDADAVDAKEVDEAVAAAATAAAALTAAALFAVLRLPAVILTGPDIEARWRMRGRALLEEPVCVLAAAAADVVVTGLLVHGLVALGLASFKKSM